MSNKSLEYIATERAKGVPDEEIMQAFYDKGWTKQQVKNLFAPPKEKINWATFFIGSSLFQGRISKRNYAIIFVLAALMNYLYLHTSSVLFKTVAWMLLFIFGVGVGIRRFHDIGRSGFWSILLYIPIIGLLIGLFMCYKKGNEGPNKYGEPEDPKRNFFKSLLNF